LIGLPDVSPDPVLWVEAAAVSEAPCEIRPEHPAPKLVTDNLDNFGNRGDSHRLSTPSIPQDEATLTPSLAPALPCSEVIEVTEVIGYRGRPKKRATRVDSKVSLICALVANADRQDETVDAKARSRSKSRRENPL
jgi:hypothetical protein